MEEVTLMLVRLRHSRLALPRPSS